MKLRVRAVPNASRNEVLGWETDPQAGPVLKIRVNAPPVDGKANAVLRDFLAGLLKLPKSKVVLEKGGTSRFKTFVVPDGTELP